MFEHGYCSFLSKVRILSRKSPIMAPITRGLKRDALKRHGEAEKRRHAAEQEKDPGGNQGRAGLAEHLMEELLAEWDPVGHTVEEVRFVIGASGEVRKDGLVYHFDHGFGGMGWLFKLKDGVVVGIEKVGID